MHDLGAPVAKISDPLSRSARTAVLLAIDAGLAGSGRWQDGVR